MDSQKKEGNLLSGLSFTEFLGKVFALEQGEINKSLTDLFKIMKRIDARSKKLGRPARHEQDLRKLKRTEKKGFDMERKWNRSRVFSLVKRLKDLKQFNLAHMILNSVLVTHIAGNDGFSFVVLEADTPGHDLLYALDIESGCSEVMPLDLVSAEWLARKMRNNLVEFGERDHYQWGIPEEVDPVEATAANIEMAVEYVSHSGLDHHRPMANYVTLGDIRDLIEFLTGKQYIL